LFPYLVALLQRSWKLFATIAKIIVPVMFLVHFADQFGVVQAAGEVLGPLMALFNLPAEAGIIWATNILVGIYGGLASLATLAPTLELTHGQLSALAAMILISHNIPVEQSIVRKAGASFLWTAVIRILVAATYGGLVAWLSQLSGWLNTPVSLTWMQGSELIGNGDQGFWSWLQGVAFSLILTFGIIVVLVLVLDLCDRLRITQRITALITPLLKLSGLHEKAAPVTTVGVLLGLSYGGALIIEQADQNNFSPRTRFLALSWLSLSHSLIEDTVLLMAVGANIWVILVGRLLFTMAVVALLARLTLSGPFKLAEHPGPQYASATKQ